MQSMAYISRLVCRFAVFESIYLQREGSIKEFLATHLCSSVERLYSTVLQYIIEVILYLNRSSAGTQCLRPYDSANTPFRQSPG